jgi:DNA ligase (NAD+)
MRWGHDSSMSKGSFFEINSVEDFNLALEKATKAADYYYNGTGDIILTDAEYDDLLELITEVSTSHPDWETFGLLDKVAAGVSSGGDVQHPSPMLSLNKTKDIEEIKNFVAGLSQNSDSTVTECKMDGLAVRVEYLNGEISLVATRGDGETGENVTKQSLNIVGLPKTISEKTFLEVRGEVYMTSTQFDKACEERLAAKKAVFVNPRNAVAGLLRNFTDTPSVNLMSFACYDADGEFVKSQDSHAQRMKLVEELGIHTTIGLLPEINPNGNVEETILKIEEKRPNLGFPIDGAVVKVDSIKAREVYGSVSRHPKWAVAFKYQDIEVPSTLRSIELTIGKTGRLAIVGNIDPVFVAGVTISRASLHNVDWLLNSGLGVGSRVAVSRANDVVPRIMPLSGVEGEKVSPWVPPAQCPQCGGEWDKKTLLWRCMSTECSIVSTLAYWASRDCLDIDRLGETICEVLVNEGLVNNVADLYDLSVTDLENLTMGETLKGNKRMLGTANAVEIIKGIEKSKQQPFHRVLAGLSIPMTGRTVSRWLASHFKNMPNLQKATVEDIAEIDKMGLIKAQAVVDGLKKLDPVITKLTKHGLTMQVQEDNNDKPLNGQTYVVSGSVPGYTRTTVLERIEELGGKTSSSVSNNITALVSNETNTSKAKKAAELGITVISAEDFAELLNKNNKA